MMIHLSLCRSIFFSSDSERHSLSCFPVVLFVSLNTLCDDLGLTG